VLTPLADWFVTKLPRWLAPNTITMTGLVLVGNATAVQAYYTGGGLEGDAPAWVYWNCVVSMLCYQFLDVCDGKQARRTGNGSPLGLLFDHGIDALNVVVGGVALATSLQMGATWRAPAIVLVAMVAFFFGTWEHYYTGMMYLPPFNGPNEGLLMVMAFHAFTAVMGPAVWTEPCSFYPALPWNSVLLVASTCMTTVTILANVRNVVSHVQAHPVDGQTPASALLNTLPFLVLVFLTISWIVWSPSNILDQYPQLVLWSVGLLSCKLIMHMMLAHLCHSNLFLMRKTLIPIAVVAVHSGFQCVTKFLAEPYCIEPLMEERKVAMGLAMLSFITYTHMVYNLVQEIKVILGIHCFTVKPYKDE